MAQRVPKAWEHITLIMQHQGMDACKEQKEEPDPKRVKGGPSPESCDVSSVAADMSKAPAPALEGGADSGHILNILFHLCKNLDARGNRELVSSLSLVSKSWRATVQSSVERLSLRSVSQVGRQQHGHKRCIHFFCKRNLPWHVQIGVCVHS